MRLRSIASGSTARRTNADFAELVAATTYVTFAEWPVAPALYPGAEPELRNARKRSVPHAKAADAASRGYPHARGRQRPHQTSGSVIGIAG